MERLTQWIDENRAIPRVDLRRCGHGRCTTQLARSEDTGLTPEQIRELKERDTAKVLEGVLEEINKLKSECLSGKYGTGYKSGALDMANAIKDIIRKHLSRENDPEITRCSQDNDGWIPVEERLPEEKKSVLVQWEKYDRHLNVTLTYLDVMWLDDAEEKVFETTNGVPNGKVIAWRPLPEPYRPERSEK